MLMVDILITGLDKFCLPVPDRRLAMKYSKFKYVQFYANIHELYNRKGFMTPNISLRNS